MRSLFLTRGREGAPFLAIPGNPKKEAPPLPLSTSPTDGYTELLLNFVEKQ
jgi:hypothetical protein